jgi:Ser/Thr protein kinase RdoA (MazF antagonist)
VTYFRLFFEARTTPRRTVHDRSSPAGGPLKMSPDRSISHDTLERMIQFVDPAWELREADPSPRGHTAVYHVDVETDDGLLEAVLKASPDGDAHGIATEAHLLAILQDRTSIPVPPVIAVVDGRDDLPTPFFLMETMPGTALPYEETRHVDDTALRRMARQTGAYLGELHAVGSIEGFGVVSADRTGRTVGGRPSADPGKLVVAEGATAWPDFLRASVEPELEKVGTSRFSDLAPRLQTAIHGGIEGLRSSDAPVLGRIDHGVHNLLIDRETGDIRTVIDWGFTLAVTPGYDLVTVEYVLSGAVLAPLPGASDRREQVRDAMARGYREFAQYPADELAAARRSYELMAVIRAMNHLEAGVAKVPAGSEEPVAAGLQRDAERLLD